jgi:YVTN family beta-propeller protein
MSRERKLLFLAIFCGLAALLTPALASARYAYFTASTEGGLAEDVELISGLEGSFFRSFASEGAPPAVAITPDGRTAYIVGGEFEESNFAGVVVPVDVATETEEAAIQLPGEDPRDIAITPDGTKAYVTDPFAETVTPIDLVAGTAGTPIPVPGEALGIAITPDGKTAYVSIRDKEEVVPIDLASGAVGASIEVGEVPLGVAVAPDGSGVYVVNELSDTVSRIDPATNAVTATIPFEGQDLEWIAVAPDSQHAYISGGNTGVVPVDLTSGVASTPVSTEGSFTGRLAILPDGSRVYVAQSGELRPLATSTNAFEAGVVVGNEPFALAIVPDQPPRASFTVNPGTTTPGTKVAFDASASEDTDGGSVVRYDWDFGDGTSLPNGGPTPTHAFPKEPEDGTYTVTLTVTDNEGCSLEKIFPGQTMLCNGSSIARTTRPVQVRVDCPTASASATSFVPVFRPAHIVPGVRVRLASSVPSRLDVDATLEWNGKAAKLATRSVDVEHWRRIRYAIPAKARAEVALGSHVTLKLHVVASPLLSGFCASTSFDKALRLKVVKVIAGAEQHGRRR